MTFTTLGNAIAAVMLLGAATVPVTFAQSPGLDLSATKPKTAESGAVTPSPAPIGASPLRKPGEVSTGTTQGTAAPGGIGPAIRNPLAKGVLGAGPANKPAAQDDPAASNDVVVRMPSNMKK